MRKIVEKSMLGKVWVAGDVDKNLEKDLINQILDKRGITDKEEIRKFLNPSVKEYMPNPNVLLGMDRAVQIISDSIINNKKIAVYGDYDVDGITSSAVFVKYLRTLGVDVIWHLPLREGEGYGLNIDAIENLAKDGANLIITVDCGISGVQEVAYAKNLGLDVVITDHHVPDIDLPNADAIVNPKQEDDTSGLDYMAGVGVAFLTVVATNRRLLEVATDEKLKEKLAGINLINYLDLVALGTVCDTMPLIGINRAFVATGLKVLSARKNLGLKTLMEMADVKNINVYVLGFVLGPRLNAAGRLDSAAPALELLLTDNVLIARDLSEKLNDMNKKRIGIQNQILLDATEMAQTLCDSGKNSLFICNDNWHGGIMGIIAGRLKEKYSMPVCVATKNNGIINGSGRSVSNVNLGSIIQDALSQGILSEGGGHSAAAGFTLKSENENLFCEFLEKNVLEQLDGKPRLVEIYVDAELDAAGANMKLIDSLSALEPFGQKNPEPVLVLHGARLGWATVMGGGGHLRGNINTNNGQLAFVGFNLVGTKVGDFLLDDMNTNTNITMVGKLKENNYNGRTSAQFVLEDLYV